MVTLRPIQQDDFELVDKWANDPALSEYFRRFPPAYTWCTPASFLAYVQGMFLIRKDEESVGLLSLNNFDSQNRKAELGIALLPFQGRRAAAASAAIQAGEYVFNYLGYNKLYCLALTHRQDIGKLLTEFNFSKEGTLRENIFWNGSFYDEDLYAITAERFRTLKE